MFVSFLYILKFRKPWNPRVTGFDIVQAGNDCFGTTVAHFSELLNIRLMTLRKNRTLAVCSYFMRSCFRITAMVITVLCLVY